MDDIALAKYVATEYSENDIKREGVRNIIPMKVTGATIRKLVRKGDQSGLYEKTETRAPDIKFKHTNFTWYWSRTGRGNISRLQTESQHNDNQGEDRLMNPRSKYGRNKMVRYRHTVI